MRRTYDVYEIAATLRELTAAMAAAAELQARIGGRVRVYRVSGRLLRRRVLVTELHDGGAR